MNCTQRWRAEARRARPCGHKQTIWWVDVAVCMENCLVWIACLFVSLAYFFQAVAHLNISCTMHLDSRCAFWRKRPCQRCSWRGSPVASTTSLRGCCWLKSDPVARLKTSRFPPPCASSRPLGLNCALIQAAAAVAAATLCKEWSANPLLLRRP